MMLALSVPAIAFFYLSFSVPESPSWLVKNGRIERRRKVLSRSADPDEVNTALQRARGETNARRSTLPLFAFGVRVVLVGVALVGVPAARRHQHGAVLRPGDLRRRWVITWTPRSSASLVACIVNLLCHDGRGAHRRQGGAQAAADLRRPDHGPIDAHAGIAVPFAEHRAARRWSRSASTWRGLRSRSGRSCGSCSPKSIRRRSAGRRCRSPSRRNGSRTCWCPRRSRCCSATTR